MRGTYKTIIIGVIDFLKEPVHHNSSSGQSQRLPIQLLSAFENKEGRSETSHKVELSVVEAGGPPGFFPLEFHYIDNVFHFLWGGLGLSGV